MRAETSLEETAGRADTFLSEVSQEQGATGHVASAPCTAGRRTTRSPGALVRRRARPQRPVGRGRRRRRPQARRGGHRLREPVDGLLHRLPRPDDTGADGHGVPRCGGRAGGAPGCRVRDDAHRRPWLGRPRPRRHPLPGRGPGGGHRPAGSVRPPGGPGGHSARRPGHVGDLVLNSPLDAATDEVGAYEELVGNHGGLGGWQTRAVLVHPTHGRWTTHRSSARTRCTGSWCAGCGCRPAHLDRRTAATRLGAAVTFRACLSRSSHPR